MEMMTPEAEILDDGGNSAALAIRPLDYASVASLEAALNEWAQKREVIARFIQQNLTKDVDYGPIHISKNCDKDARACANKHHFSKNVLFKPGSEKVAALLQLRPTFQRDNEVWEMLGSPAGIICLRCLLLTPSGEIAGEGRGARDVQKHDRGDINKAIKMCEKVAQVDAVLRTLALSDVFTQDLEEKGGHDERPKPVSQQPERRESARTVTPRATMQNVPLLDEIEARCKAIISPLRNTTMHKAIYAMAFQVASPGGIAACAPKILEEGMPVFRHLTAQLERGMWDKVQAPMDWIEEQYRAFTAEVPAGVDPETGEDLSDMPTGWLTKHEEQRLAEEAEMDAIERFNNA